MTATCPLHQRPSEQTCNRCGVFLCDWCVKLAPDWGAGLCHECLRHDPPRTAVMRVTLTSAFVVALLALLGLASTVSLFQSIGDPDATAASRVGSGIAAVIGISGSVLVIAMNRHRR